ncbi:MAG: co-chaperone GroES [bacterium]|nr:co-chaperone GroES [bacterium]
MNIKPLGDRVLIEPLSGDEMSKKTKGGIFIPDTADKEKPQEGKVLAVGEGRRLENGTAVPVGVKVGDHVIYRKYTGDEFKVPARNASNSDAGGDDKEYLIAKEEDILGIISG